MEMAKMRQQMKTIPINTSNTT